MERQRSRTALGRWIPREVAVGDATESLQRAEALKRLLQSSSRYRRARKKLITKRWKDIDRT